MNVANHAQLAVYSIFIIDVVQTGVTSQALWHFAIDIWGDPDALVTTVPWSEPFIPFFSGLGMLPLIWVVTTGTERSCSLQWLY